MKIPSFGKLFLKLSAKTEKNAEFWQVIFQNYLPKHKKKGIFVYI